MISIPFQKKPLKGTYLIGYLSEVIMVYSIINLDFDKEFKKNQQQLILTIELKKDKPFKITISRKFKEARKPGNKVIRVIGC